MDTKLQDCNIAKHNNYVKIASDIHKSSRSGKKPKSGPNYIYIHSFNFISLGRVNLSAESVLWGASNELLTSRHVIKMLVLESIKN